MSTWDQHRLFDRYIDALLSFSPDSQKFKTWLDQSLGLQATLDAYPALTRALADPRVNKARKEALILELAKDMSLDQTLARTLAVFIRQGRGEALNGFVAHLAGRLKAAQGVVTATVTSAQELTAAQHSDLARSLGDKVELNTSVDPELLGGLVVQIGSWRMDDSVKGKLERLTRRLKSAA